MFGSRSSDHGVRMDAPDPQIDAPGSQVDDPTGERPWRARLHVKRLPTIKFAIQSWFFTLVKPRRSDFLVTMLGLACFLSSLALEASLLLRFPERPALVIGSLITVALLLASCCMGVLVKVKGPEWADETEDAAWAPERRSAPQVRRGARPPAPALALSRAVSLSRAPAHAPPRSVCARQPTRMVDEGSESEDEERHLLHHRGRAAAADFAEEEYCLNCLLDECVAMVGAMVGVVCVGAGLALGYDIAAALHNEQVIMHLLADPGGMVRTHSQLTHCLRRHNVMRSGLNDVIWTDAGHERHARLARGIGSGTAAVAASSGGGDASGGCLAGPIIHSAARQHRADSSQRRLGAARSHRNAATAAAAAAWRCRRCRADLGAILLAARFGENSHAAVWESMLVGEWRVCLCSSLAGRVELPVEAGDAPELHSSIIVRRNDC